MSDEIIKAFKGMDSALKCQGFQYKVGKEYESPKAKACEVGFHACKSPMDVLSYYPAAGSRFFEVEQSGEIDTKEDKTCSSKISIKAEIGIIGLVKAHIEYVFSRITKKKEKLNEEVRGAASNSGNSGAASNSGYRGAASNSGNSGAASNSGNRGAASNSGKYGIAVAWGICSKAMISTDDSYMVLSDWREIKNEWKLHKAHIAKVGDTVCKTKIKANVWYWFEDGKLKQESAK